MKHDLDGEVNAKHRSAPRSDDGELVEEQRELVASTPAHTNRIIKDLEKNSSHLD